jgi:lipid-binding SYLF domain-containing protein
MNKLICLVIACLFTGSAIADEFQNSIATFKQSRQVQSFFSNSYGYAIFPTIGKGGIIIGGAYGEGKVYVNGQETGTSTMVQGTIGFQLGGQAFSEVIFFENKRAFNEFIRDGFEFGAQASATAITAGAQAQVGTSGTTVGATAGAENQSQHGSYIDGIATFTYTIGGLMYEASLGGQTFSYKATR